MYLIFTDLDGTLLDHDTYEWAPARPALAELGRCGIPWVLVTSKTRAEVELLRREMGHGHPFIVENGGAAYVPDGSRPGGYRVLEWGTPYGRLAADLRSASQETGCRARGFADMTVEETARLCGLSLAQADLARQREYDEPFIVEDTARAGLLRAALEARGHTVTEGGRFWHVMGANDKGHAVRQVAARYEQAHGPVRTIGLGDGLNDAAFLNVVDVPVIIRSSRAEELQRAVPRGQMTRLPGPAGWNEVVLELVAG